MWMKDVCRHFWVWHVSFIMTTTQEKQQNLGQVVLRILGENHQITSRHF
jgi:hypothetical protein